LSTGTRNYRKRRKMTSAIAAAEKQTFPSTKFLWIFFGGHRDRDHQYVL
jgi:hypothetical protein